MKKLLIASLLALAGTTAAQANTILTSVNLNNPYTVRYVNFNVSDAGSFDIDGQGSSTLDPNSVYNSDPQMFLFRDSLSVANNIASDDDSGWGLDALINNIYLSIGNYILAVSEYELTLAEAISGYNGGNDVDDEGSVRVTISSYNGYASFGHVRQVSEPVTLGLLGLGLLGLAVARRRSQRI